MRIMVREEDLLEDHRSIDIKLEKLLSLIEEGELDPSLFMDIRSGLIKHIFVEEEYSFPSVMQLDSSISARLTGLEMEHAAIWMLLDRVRSEIESGEILKSPKFIREIADILRAHNDQEEEYVYPVILKISSESGPDFSDVMVPAGWICHRLRKNKQ